MIVRFSAGKFQGPFRPCGFLLSQTRYRTGISCRFCRGRAKSPDTTRGVPGAALPGIMT
jgi:hypothetical protein